MSSTEAKAINARILYWGIEGSGKTTNLEAIRSKLRSDHSGELRYEPTRIDPTVSYEVLPIQLGDVGGRPTRIEIVAVPDGDEQAPTRKQLLNEVSGVVLVIDSQPGREAATIASRNELVEAFASYGRDLSEIPVIVQYNKRDLANDNQIEALHRAIALPSAAVFEAVAREGTGVLQTLTTISKRVVKTMRDGAVLPKPKLAIPAEPVAPIEAAEVVAAPAPRSTREMLEDAIEADLAESGQVEARGGAVPDALEREARSTFDSSFEELAADDKPSSEFRLGADLRIVSVGTATRAGERSVRIPLVLGDANGQTASIALTVALDPMLEDTDAGDA